MSESFLQLQNTTSFKLTWIVTKLSYGYEGTWFETNIFNIPFYKEAYWRLSLTREREGQNFEEVCVIELCWASSKIEHVTGKVYVTSTEYKPSIIARMYFKSASFNGSGAKFNVRLGRFGDGYNKPRGDLELCFEINWPSQPKLSSEDTLYQKFRGLLFSTKDSDVILKTKEEEIPAHKSVLSAHSSVFSAMFHSGMQEERVSLVEITDIRLEVLKEMLIYAYTGLATIKGLALDLMIAADKYNMRELFIGCRDWLMDNFSAETAPQVLIIADGIHDDVLKMAVLDFIALNLEEVTNSSHWANLVQSHASLMECIIKRICSLKRPKRAGC